MRFTFAIAAAACGLMTVAAIPAEARINQRQERQDARIDRGAANGGLTEREERRLERQQRQIERYEARSRADGPGLTRRERVHIEVAQDRASRNIRRQRHDRQRG